MKLDKCPFCRKDIIISSPNFEIQKIIDFYNSINLSQVPLPVQPQVTLPAQFQSQVLCEGIKIKVVRKNKTYSSYLVEQKLNLHIVNQIY